MASKAERDAGLDELGTAISDWAAAERKRLNTQVALAKKMLKGRTGSERLAQASVESASVLTVDEISDFLTGDV